MRTAIAGLLLAVAACNANPPAPPPAPAPPAPAITQVVRHWTCAAYCVTEYHCKSNGDSSWKSELKTSQGPDAAGAFKALVDKCDNSVEMLVTHFTCSEGKSMSEGATIASSCAAD